MGFIDYWYSLCILLKSIEDIEKYSANSIRIPLLSTNALNTYVDLDRMNFGHLPMTIFTDDGQKANGHYDFFVVVHRNKDCMDKWLNRELTVSLCYTVISDNSENNKTYKIALAADEERAMLRRIHALLEEKINKNIIELMDYVLAED